MGLPDAVADIENRPIRWEDASRDGRLDKV
jgi:hypothetical protein